MEIAIGMAIFFVLITAVYVAITLFLPEWVGITGNRAKEITKHQQEETNAEGDPSAPLSPHHVEAPLQNKVIPPQE